MRSPSSGMAERPAKLSTPEDSRKSRASSCTRTLLPERDGSPSASSAEGRPYVIRRGACGGLVPHKRRKTAEPHPVDIVIDLGDDSAGPSDDDAQLQAALKASLAESGRPGEDLP